MVHTYVNKHVRLLDKGIIKRIFYFVLPTKRKQQEERRYTNWGIKTESL